MKTAIAFTFGLAAGLLISSYSKKPKQTEPVNKTKNETLGI